MIHARTLHALEFDQILQRLSALCVSAVGRNRALALAPLPNVETVAAAASLHEEAALWAEAAGAGTAFQLEAFPDVGGFLDAARQDRHFHPDADAFWALREVLRRAKAARDAIVVPDAERRWPHLLFLANSRPFPAQLTAALQRCISDDGLLRDESSPELYRLRGELRRLHQNCMRKVKEFAAQYNLLAYLQDEFMTLSSDRYVLPLKANFKGRVQGVIHDWSQTGETCYFEPMFLVELNNRLQALKREEREEERKVLAYLGDLLLAELPGAAAAQELLAQLDVLQAQRCLAAQLRGRIVPLTGEGDGIQLLEARHPILLLHRADALSKSGREAQRAFDSVRPLDIVLRPGERALVITGGNAGGKTVCLKTLGLLAAMTLTGLPVPAGPGSHLPWFGRLDAFIGDEQSLSDNVSTFTAQIEHLAKAWKHLDAGSLALLDEFGAGTDPAQGAALAQAVLDGLLEKQAFVLAATHFPALKSYALTKEGTRAASMLFDPETRRPLFVLAYDQVGASRALDVAREHGLPDSVLRQAERYLLQDGGDVSALLDRLNVLAARREEEIAHLRKEQDKARRQAESSRERLAREREALQGELRGSIAEVMRAWKEGKATAKQTLKELSRLRAPLLSSVEDRQSVLPQPDAFSVGQEVLHLGFNKKGVVKDVDARRNRVRLDLQGVTLWAAAKDVRMAGQATSAPAAVQMGTLRRTAAEDTASLTLDLRGQRAENALAELGRFLDKALLAGFSEVEVIHGRGTGVLRRQVHDFLRAFPSVDRFATAPEDRGGDGMTIVTLR